MVSLSSWFGVKFGSWFDILLLDHFVSCLIKGKIRSSCFEEETRAAILDGLVKIALAKEAFIPKHVFVNIDIQIKEESDFMKKKFLLVLQNEKSFSSSSSTCS